MKKILIKGLFALSLTAVMTTSCTKDFEQINTDPNTAPVELAAPNYLLTNAIEAMTDRLQGVGVGHEIGSCWVQHMAKVQYTDEDRYLPRVSTINILWSSLYATSGNDIDAMLSAALGQENTSYEGIAIVLRSYVVAALTDMYGDVPFDEAWKTGEGIASPAYTAQADIYVSLLADLDYANSILDPAADDVDGDILYGGNVLAWKKFANSLRMRLLLRQSAKVDPSTDMKAMLADPAKYPLFDSNGEQAELQYLADSPNNSPLVENRKTRDDHRVSKTYIDYAYVDHTDWDSRVFAFAEPTDGTGDLAGLPNGLTSAKAGAYNGGGLLNTSAMGKYFTTGTPTGVLMSYVELQFILAEAAHKGFIDGGEIAAKGYYDEAIIQSFMYYKDQITAGLENVYGFTPTFGDDNAGTDVIYWHLKGSDWVYDAANADYLIGMQKWASMFDQGLQAWIEYNRTGYPVLVAGEDAVLDEVPSRLTYPLDEYSRNSTNVNAAVGSLSGGDKLTSKVWWAN